MNKKHSYHAVLFFLLGIFLNACGMGGSSSSSVSQLEEATQDLDIATSNSFSITRFGFDQKNNPKVLANDVVGKITNQKISVTLPHGTNIKALKASFSVVEKAIVKVGEQEQISGVTVNDFTKKITYTISTSSTSQTYQVQVQCLTTSNQGKNQMKLKTIAVASAVVAASACGSGKSGSSDSKKKTDENPNPPNPSPPKNLNINDPLYSKQWHLKNTIFPSFKLQGGGETKADVNVEPVWGQKIFGKGIKVGIFDMPIDHEHPDLKDNLPPNHVMNDYPNDPVCSTYTHRGKKYDTGENHGTNVAGIIAAKDNNIGVRGIAPQATLYGYAVARSRYAPPGSNDSWNHLEKMLKAFNRPEYQEIAVYNGSISDGGKSERALTTDSTETLVLKAFDKVTTDGFGGLGSSLVFAAGNEAEKGSVTANNHFLNHYAVIGVGAVYVDGTFIKTKGNQYSIITNLSGTSGANLWLVAPAGARFGKYKIMTTIMRCGQKPILYKTSFGATSSAAPMVTGVIALLRSAYPKLTWRDVKLILAESAKKIAIDPARNFDWQKTGKMYSNPTKDQSHHRVLGFGLVDAAAALSLAKDWTPLPSPMKARTFTQNNELNTQADDVLHESNLQVQGSQIKFIESVVVDLEIERTDELGLFWWALSLVSPDGKVGWIYRELDTMDEHASIDAGITQLRFKVNAFLGNALVNGTWKLRLQTRTQGVQWLKNEGKIQKIKNWKLTVRGH